MVRREKQASDIQVKAEIETIDEKERTIVHTITTSVVDRYGDIVDPKGMNDKNFEKNPIVLYGHSTGSLWGLTGGFVPIVGKSLWRKVEGEVIKSKTQFGQSTDFMEDAWNLAKDGFLPAVSIGFMPKAYEVTKLSDVTDLNPANRSELDASMEVVIWRKWELLEYSLVPIPANPEALQNAFTVARSTPMLKMLEAMKREQSLCELEQCKQGMESLPQRIEQIESLIINPGISVKDFEEMKSQLEELKSLIEQPKTTVETVAVKAFDPIELAREAGRRAVSRAKGHLN